MSKNSRIYLYKPPIRWYPVVVCIVIAIIILYLLNVKLEMESWNKTSGFYSFLSVPIAVAIFLSGIFYERHTTYNEFKNRIRNALLTLQNDVKDIRESLYTKPEYDSQRKKVQSEGIDITTIQIGTEVYDSILSSGLFTYFQKESQLTLGNFYFNIKLHNKELSEKIRFEFEHKFGYSNKDHSVYTQVDKEVAVRLTGYEKEIIEMNLPLTIRNLKQHLITYKNLAPRATNVTSK